MTDNSMIRAIIADNKPFQSQYFAERAEQEARTARVGDDLADSDRAEISRLSGTEETPTAHASEVDRLLSVAEEVQEKPHERAVTAATDEEWRHYYGPKS